MRKFAEIVMLELRSLVRSRTLAMLVVATVAWMFGLPHVLKGDGTAEGARELYLRFSLGGVFVLTVVALLSSATGSLARERVAKRLQLTMVRPVRCFVLFLGKAVAHMAVGAVVLLTACAALALEVGLSAPCYHVLSPVLPSVKEEAAAMYEAYMKDPQTPEAVKKAKKEVVLRILAARAVDHYQSIPTNEVTSWRFPKFHPQGTDLRVRMRFAAQFDTRQDVRGRFTLGDWAAPVSNITQAVVTVPLSQSQVTEGPADALTFFNGGKDALMLRPRKDINVLLPADAFGFNLLRAFLVLLAILSLVVSFGLFLSAGLGRPVALFVALVTLIVGEMSPSVLEQYPEELGANVTDRIGLFITRVAVEATSPISSATPLESLANDECVEPKAVVRSLVLDAVALPLILAFLSALVIPRKQEDAE